MNKFFLKNKKGEKLISLYWFVILTLVAGGIFLMVNSFYNSPYDVRELESNILADKVVDCIYSGGEISPLLLGPGNKFKDSFRDNFMALCSLTFDTKEKWDPEPHFVKIVFYGDERKLSTFYNITAGNRNYEEDCFAEESYEEFAKCSKKEFYATSSEGRTYFVEVLAATGKTEENI
jgi:hypothetical protein